MSLPIEKVTRANAKGTSTGTPVTNLPAPSKGDWSKQDLSAPDAGRLESGRMLKKRVGKVDRLDLEWRALTKSQASKVLKAFDHEYVNVKYLDAKGGAMVEKHFYVGDMATTGWLPHLGRWESVTLAIIRATPDKG